MNKKIFFLLLLSTIGILFQGANIPSQELFLQGNRNFCEGDFKAARQCYEQVPHKSSAVWHNMGNCYYNEHNDAQALVCWRRAQKDAGFNQLEQLFESEQMVLKKLNCSHDGIYMRGVKKVILALPKIVLQLLAILFLLLFLYWFYQCLIRKSDAYQLLSCRKRYLIMLGLGIIVCLLLLGAKEKFLQEKQGVLIHDKVVVHAGPEQSFHKKSQLPLGCVVQVVDETSDMVKISCDKGSGWIISSNVEIV